jgi:hypothetical protein
VAIVNKAIEDVVLNCPAPWVDPELDGVPVDKSIFIQGGPDADSKNW